MPDETPIPEKKLHIDEDWKSQVEAEKAAARAGGQAEDSAASRPAPTDDQAVPLPPASLSFLIGTMYMQGAISLGMLSNPVTNKQEAQPEHAKHTIDMLAMLQRKTEGNRTKEESEELDAALHELRMAYVSLSNNKAGE
ncbi:MAG: DUF1844 domain-containing protein [Pirellulaceae bacterium]|nr:DUF1844 domain-containing protein [Pirellulaceae bacterium]